MMMKMNTLEGGEYLILIMMRTRRRTMKKRNPCFG
jgi:hypothetical protein